MKKEDFWSTDLKDIEATFLKKGQVITDLPLTLDNRVPASELLDISRFVDINKIIPKIGMFQKMK